MEHKKSLQIGVPDSDRPMSPTPIGRSRGHRFRGVLYGVKRKEQETQTEHPLFGTEQAPTKHEVLLGLVSNQDTIYRNGMEITS